jgi:Rhodopirellula transposase DDE domain
MEQRPIHHCQCPVCQQPQPHPTQTLHAQINLLLSTLDERQRRLYAGLESKKMGYGGDRHLARITGLSVNTIAKGRHELDDLDPDSRIRQPGAGRPPVEKKDPSILAILEQLLQEDTAGDPTRRLKWKRQSLHRLSELLGTQHPASTPTVGRLLREMDYSPKLNRKQLAESSPHRDEQFRYLRSQKSLFLQRGWPVLSIDTKKRELIGWFKNPGRIWCRDPIAVNAYDFRSLATGVAIPAGMYDLARNEGFVMVGTSANTAEFMVDALRWWWRGSGHRQYPGVPGLLLLADGGGSNGYRVRLWKYSMQRRFVNPTGLRVTVCHYPTGASKWNPVEHRLFGEISTNWAGQPLINYGRVLALIRGTTTEHGLVVHATLNKRRYATRIKISDEQMQEVQLYQHRVLPQWNYTIEPTMD